MNPSLRLVRSLFVVVSVASASFGSSGISARLCETHPCFPVNEEQAEVCAQAAEWIAEGIVEATDGSVWFRLKDVVMTKGRPPWDVEGGRLMMVSASPVCWRRNWDIGQSWVNLRIRVFGTHKTDERMSVRPGAFAVLWLDRPR